MAEPERRLLVVDDEPQFGEYVRRVAEGMGFDVRVASSGKDFKTLYEEFSPTVVVLDVFIPEIDGIELVDWLTDRHCRARVIIVSGHDAQYAETARILGAARGLRDVLTLAKPVRLADLRQALS